MRLSGQDTTRPNRVRTIGKSATTGGMVGFARTRPDILRLSNSFVPTCLVLITAGIETVRPD